MKLREIQKKYVLILAVILAVLLIMTGSLYAYRKFSRNDTVGNTPPEVPSTSAVSESSVTPVPGTDANPSPQSSAQSGEETPQTILTAAFEGCQRDPEADFRNEKDMSYRDSVLKAGLLAFAKKDISVCSLTGSARDESGSTCEEKYILLTTLSTAGSDCGKIGNRDLSLSCSANQKRDPAVCGQISDAARKTVCEAVVSGDAGKCGDLPDDRKGGCSNTVTFVKALNGRDVGACDRIDSAVVGGMLDKTFCKISLSQDSQKAWNDYYANSVCPLKYAGAVAKEKNDVSFCENIPGKDVENKKPYSDCVAQFK